jgi:ATP-binding cassette, subfamily F, member 3
MILLQASHIAKQFEGHVVLTDASVVIQSGERVALVGVNGAGKSTLLRILIGQDRPDGGDLSVAKDTEVGYVAQFVDAGKDMVVYDYVGQSFAEIYKMEAALRAYQQEIANPEVYEDERRYAEITSAYDRLLRQFEDVNGYAVEARIRRVLDGLQFPPEMRQLPVSVLSGGQKTRLSLARLLATEPDVLVLDEPTNYLDTDTLTWLEDYLKTYAGALLVVSHDRYFLNKVVNVVYELEDGKTTRYVGNYSDYIEEKSARYEADIKRYEAQQEEIQRMEEFVRKNIVRATTTKRAQSRRKMLERMTRLDKPSVNTPKMALSFTTLRASGKDVLQVRDVVVGYPGKPLPGPLNLYVARGQRLAILGPNGIGKTSFLKALMGQLPPIQGSIRFGTNVDIGYYDQEQTHLHPNKTVLQEIWDEYPSLDRTAVRTALGRFLFRGEDVNKPVANLSGGERSRLSLCRLMLQGSNTLVMDEPTNHLDLLSKEVLEDALADYEGTLLFVSHDRYFIDALATHVVVLNESGFTVYIGNYTDYMRKRADDEKWVEDDDALAEESNRGPHKPLPKSPSKDHQDQKDHKTPDAAKTHSPGVRPDDAGRASPTAETRHVRSADLRKARDRVTLVEEKIEDIETRLNQLGEEMTEAAVNQNVDLTLALQKELDALNQMHAEQLTLWEKYAAELEELESYLP